MAQVMLGLLRPCYHIAPTRDKAVANTHVFIVAVEELNEAGIAFGDKIPIGDGADYGQLRMATGR